MPRKSKRLNHKPLLENPLVRTWYEENCLRSSRTADVNLRQLGLCLHELGLTPDTVLETARADAAALRSGLVEYATALQRRGRLNSYIAKTFVGLTSFLRHHEVEFRGIPRLTVVRGESIENERVPTQEELARLLRALSLRGQVSALLMAHSGLRPGSFSVYRAGESALRLRDLGGLDLKRLRFAESPFLIRVPGSLSKSRKAYVTFGTQELADALSAYLRERQARPRWSKGVTVAAEVLSPDSPVVAVRDTETETGFVTVKAVTAEIRTAMLKVVPDDTSWRPYVLRSYASTQLLIAESKGKITRDFREAILGHDLGVSGRYNLSKKLQPSMVEEMRAAYKRCEPFLSTVPTKGESDQVASARELLLRYAGVTEEDIAKLDLASMTNNEVLAVADKAQAAAPRIRGPLGQKAVPIADVRSMLDAGWEYVAPLGLDQAVLRGPLPIPGIRSLDHGLPGPTAT